jgi:isoleucyl-tRNA synthetase
VRLVNDRRRAEGLDLADRIRLTIDTSGRLAEWIRAHADWIAGEVLAVDLTIAESGGPEPDAVIDGSPLAIQVERA